MSLAGEGVAAIWNGILPEARADYYEWHNREHMPERVAISGFCRGRRYRALEGRPEFFTLYETRNTAVLSGADYLARLNAPTPWTRRAIVSFTDTARSLCRVALSLGPGEGGLIMTWRYDVVAGREDEHRAMLENTLDEIAKREGIAGAHLCIADRDASGIQTEEKRGRTQSLVPGWVVLVEGGAERASLENACNDLISNSFLEKLAAIRIERGLYALQNLRNPSPASA
ncbi:MAG: hypothetical protein EXR33_00465 [Betaproteobacteria bacterium]|nr:hypothetical protein [Betaproteobacteria bacterium]